MIIREISGGSEEKLIVVKGGNHEGSFCEICLRAPLR